VSVPVGSAFLDMRVALSSAKVRRVTCGSLHFPRILAPSTRASRLALSALVRAEDPSSTPDAGDLRRPRERQIRGLMVKVPRLSRKITKLRGALVLIGSRKVVTPEPVKKEERAPVILQFSETRTPRSGGRSLSRPERPGVAPIKESRPGPLLVEMSQHAVQVTVVPSPRKRQARVPEVKTQPPRPPKLIKVIRRRGEQAPKVFETVTETFPKAMLEGAKVELEEDEER